MKNEDEDLVRLHGTLRPFAESEARELPDRVVCQSCGAELVTLKKDEKTKKIGIQVHTTIPPVILNRAERVGLLTCHKCGAKSQFDLLIFGGR